MSDERLRIAQEQHDPDYSWADQQAADWLRRQLSGCLDDAIALEFLSKDDDLKQIARRLIGDIRDAIRAIPGGACR